MTGVSIAEDNTFGAGAGAVAALGLGEELTFTDLATPVAEANETATILIVWARGD